MFGVQELRCVGREAVLRCDASGGAGRAAHASNGAPAAPPHGPRRATAAEASGDFAGAARRYESAFHPGAAMRRAAVEERLGNGPGSAAFSAWVERAARAGHRAGAHRTGAARVRRSMGAPPCGIYMELVCVWQFVVAILTVDAFTSSAISAPNLAILGDRDSFWVSSSYFGAISDKFG